MLPTVSLDRTVALVMVVRDTAGGAGRKQGKYWGGRDASMLKVACHEVDSPFVRCRKEH